MYVCALSLHHDTEIPSRIDEKRYMWQYIVILSLGVINSWRCEAKFDQTATFLPSRSTGKFDPNSLPLTLCCPHVCLLGLGFLGVCSAVWVRLGQLTSSELVCDLLFWAKGSAKAKKWTVKSELVREKMMPYHTFRCYIAGI